MNKLKGFFYYFFPTLSPEYKEQKLAEMLNQLNSDACVYIVITAIAITLWSLYFPKYAEVFYSYIRHRVNISKERVGRIFLYAVICCYVAILLFCLFAGLANVAIFAILLCLGLSVPFIAKIYASFASNDKDMRRYAINCMSKYIFLISLILLLNLFILNPNSSLCIYKVWGT